MADESDSKVDQEVGLDDLWKHGYLVSLTASRWGARKLLSLRELGIEFDNPEKEAEFLELFRPGTKKLLPAESLKGFVNLENRARAAMDHLGIEFKILRSVKYVTAKSFFSLKKLLDSLCQQYADLADAFEETYVKQRDEQLEKFSQYARDNLADVMAVGEFREKMEACYPPAEKIRKKFSIEYRVFTISSPQVDEVGAGEVEADIESKIAVQQHWQQEMKKHVTSFMEDAGKQLAQEFGEAVGNLVDLLSDGKKKFTGRSLKALERKLDALNGKNFLGYAKLDEMIVKAKEAIGQHEGGDYSPAMKTGLSNQLQKVKDAMLENLDEEVDQLVKNFGSMGKRKVKKLEPKKEGE